MNKAELVNSMSEKSGLAKKDAEKALNSLVESIEEALRGGEKVQLIGFGTFEVKERAERKGINPQTKNEMIIPASKSAGFKVGKSFKDSINS